MLVSVLNIIDYLRTPCKIVITSSIDFFEDAKMQSYLKKFRKGNIKFKIKFQKINVTFKIKFQKINIFIFIHIFMIKAKVSIMVKNS